MLADAWFDITTASPGYRPTAIAMAVVFEIPFGAGCVAFALRGLRAG
jgi:hypothetical protein